MRRPDGGPAFPVPGEPGHYVPAGMSLRDYFAGQALIGIIASSPIVDRTDLRRINKSGWAAHAYGFADAMIAQREKAQP